MNLKDQLQTMAKGKNASYSAIADYLLARKSYAGLKLKEVAHACHVSVQTVVRFCQNLGYDGFSDLKYNLTNVLQQKCVSLKPIFIFAGKILYIFCGWKNPAMLPSSFSPEKNKNNFFPCWMR